jgi:drug/metabolite transporter (DMT)-like permease
MPAGLASLVLQLQAAFTVGLAVLLLGERPRPAQLAGGALALGEAPRAPELIGAAVVLGGLALTVGLTAPRPAREARPSCATHVGRPSSQPSSP